MACHPKHFCFRSGPAVAKAVMPCWGEAGASKRGSQCCFGASKPSTSYGVSNVAGYDWTLGPAHNADIRFEKPRNRNSQALNRETDSIRLWKILEGLDVVAALAGQMFPVLDGDFTYAAWWTAAVCGLF